MRGFAVKSSGNETEDDFLGCLVASPRNETYENKKAPLIEGLFVFVAPQCNVEHRCDVANQFRSRSKAFEFIFDR